MDQNNLISLAASPHSQIPQPSVTFIVVHYCSFNDERALRTIIGTPIVDAIVVPFLL